ncbi:MAG: exodeoxyribonuclease VII large subunit [Spongiibacteraceae bacterium]
MIANNAPESLSVNQLNRLAKNLLEDCFGNVSVSGELSTLSRPSSGHWYFTLKDDKAQIRCAFFRGKNMRLRFTPEVGQQVTIQGKVSLYEGRGDYQLIVETMQDAGVGALALAFEQLKQKLLAAGWFDDEQKLPLPEKIKHIAVISSATGAAIHDILSVIRRRWPGMKISLLPVLVQGDMAAAQIAKAISQANRWHTEQSRHFDVILLSRGGGSLEDLWPFNEEIVAKAIHQSSLPVVSAVGHEVDFSISDFVADVRAATPSAAAELLSRNQDDELANIYYLQERLSELQWQQLRQSRQHVDALIKRIRDPRSKIREQAQRLDELELRLSQQGKASVGKHRARRDALAKQLNLLNPARQLQMRHSTLQALKTRLIKAQRDSWQQKITQLQSAEQQIKLMGPQQTLERGYAIISDRDGNILRDSQQLSGGDKLTARLAQGHIDVTVDTAHND